MIGFCIEKRVNKLEPSGSLHFENILDGRYFSISSYEEKVNNPTVFVFWESVLYYIYLVNLRVIWLIE